MPVFLLLTLLVALFSVGVSNYYYGSLQKGLETRVEVLCNSFHEYFMGSGYSSYYQKAVQAAQNFEDRDIIELQFISAGGHIEVSSSGLTAGTTPGTSDISQVLMGNEKGSFMGTDPETGEQIMAASRALRSGGRVVGIMRCVTSMRLVNQQVMLAVLVIILIALLCLSMVLISNLVFINDVVEPVAVVTDAAKRISHGSYGFRVENTYTDELGELVDNINDMSMKISQNEKMKTEFISSVSHELRTPLTAITGWGETLLEDPVSDPVQTRRGMRIILNETRRLSTMVEELLDFSKMEDGRFTLGIEEVDLQAEFEDAIFTYMELFKQEGIELTYEDLGEELLPPISGDPERLKQVFCNLLDNAAKHGGAGKHIHASITREGAEQVIRIRDYGPGIPEEELPYVKQKFYKGSSKARGSGIGLAVCDEIISLHGGELIVGNAEGGGAVVTVRLPEEQ
ncbi:MAG: HAMP domain-containing histidine kinase [Oscillibacter sp.]|nr:HAMP domain-containing histidine kinase [Oscillibacter sp.]